MRILDDKYFVMHREPAEKASYIIQVQRWLNMQRMRFQGTNWLLIGKKY